MSRTDKDLPWQYGGRPPRFWISHNGWSAFKRQCRRKSRLKAKDDLRQGREPAPTYPVEREYYD